MTQVIKEKDNIFSAYKFISRTREGRDPAWLVNLREKAAVAFEALDFPTTRVEEWKYTNVAPILKVPYRESSISNLGSDLGSNLGSDLNNLNGLTKSQIEPFSFAESSENQLVFINGSFSRKLSNLISAT